jgi:hypothetical protein
LYLALFSLSSAYVAFPFSPPLPPLGGELALRSQKQFKKKKKKVKKPSFYVLEEEQILYFFFFF